MFTYANFIDELKLLLDSGRLLRDLPQRGEDQNFRRWHHEVKDLMQRIEAQKYRINHNIYTRRFDCYSSGYGRSPTAKERMAAYNQDLDDTFLELETIISHAEKYGDPKSSPVKAGVPEIVMAPASLQMPDKVTAAWLWHHSPISLWLQAISVMAVVFMAGIAVGQSSLYSDLTRKAAPADHVTHAPPSTNTPLAGKK
ncbi:MAG: hypothetical protein WAW02_04500 [Sideroxyarcus sp.]